MSSLYQPVSSGNQVVLYPYGEKKPTCIPVKGLLFKILAGAIYAGSRQYHVMLNIGAILVDIIGQLSNYYIIPKNFKPTKIYCNDSGITDIAWIYENSDKPGRVVFAYDPNDNISGRKRHTPNTLYFHNLSQLHLFLYGQLHSGHSPYSSWKVFGTNDAICGFLAKGFKSVTICKNRGIKLWGFTQNKVPPVFHNPLTKTSKKKKDKGFINLYRMEGHGVGDVVAGGTDHHGNETLDMEPYLDWVSPSGRVLKDYLFRIV